jgi:hypothetical protein
MEGQQGAREQAAHRMREDAQRLVLALAAIEFGPEALGQAAGLLAQRLAPVVGERHHAVRLAEELDQAAVGARQRLLGHDAELVGNRKLPAQPARREVEHAHPDGVDLLAGRNAQRAAHDARQQEHHRGRAARFARLAARARRLRAARDRREGVGEALILQQAGDHAPAGLAVDEIAEVADLAVAVAEDARRVLVACRAAAHVLGVDHEVVVAVVEQVGHQQCQPLEQALRLGVAGDHGQVPRDMDARPVEQAHQPRFRHHRLEAGELARIAAPFDHRRDEGGQVLGLREHRHAAAEAGEPEQVDDDAQIAIQPPRGQRGAARRAGDAHEALDAQALRREYLAERLQKCRIGLARQ